MVTALTNIIPANYGMKPCSLFVIGEDANYGRKSGGDFKSPPDLTAGPYSAKV